MKKARLRHPVAQCVSIAALTLFSILILYPYLLMLVSSLTDNSALLSKGYRVFTRDFSLGAYRYLWNKRATFFRAYGITMLVTATGTAFSLLITELFAYALSRRDFKGRRALSFYVYFTMLFNGGFVSSYILWTQFMGVKNTLWAYLLPNMLVNVMNVMIMRNYFSNNIPEAVIESGRLDGANEFQVFFRLVMPISLPINATIGLLIGLSYWNNWQNGLYFVNKSHLYSYQNLLNRMIQDIQYLASEVSASSVKIDFPSVSARMALAVIAVVPILILYPFFQRFFVKGITIGSVKG